MARQMRAMAVWRSVNRVTRLYARQAVPDRNQPLQRPSLCQLLQLLLACEGTIACSHFSRPLFVDHADIILGCDMK
jgi:hypothetical protein